MKTLNQLWEEMLELNEELNKKTASKTLFVQVFWKQGFNSFGYYTEEQLEDKNILHYTIIERIK